MPRYKLPLFGLSVALLVSATASVLPAASGATTTAPRLAGCQVFPANNYWNRDVSRLPVDSRSRSWLSHMSTGNDLHPDFGDSYGIPITIVRSSHAQVRPRFTYASESDHVGYKLGADTHIEGGRNSGGDMHSVVVDRDTCRLYETWNTRESNGRWTAGSGATWSLRSNALRPNGWTSGDAAGLPILPGLLRWNEVRAGRVSHAIRFTTNMISNHHIWPARHDGGTTSSRAFPPLGARFRMKRGFSTAGYGRDARVVIAAMKRYGLVLADAGSPWFFQGAQSSAWPPSLIAQLKKIPASAFEGVDTSSLRVTPRSAATR